VWRESVPGSLEFGRWQLIEIGPRNLRTGRHPGAKMRTPDRDGTPVEVGSTFRPSQKNPAFFSGDRSHAVPGDGSENLNSLREEAKTAPTF